VLPPRPASQILTTLNRAFSPACPQALFFYSFCFSYPFTRFHELWFCTILASLFFLSVHAGFCIVLPGSYLWLAVTCPIDYSCPVQTIRARAGLSSLAPIGLSSMALRPASIDPFRSLWALPCAYYRSLTLCSFLNVTPAVRELALPPTIARSAFSFALYPLSSPNRQQTPSPSSELALECPV